MLGGQVTVPLTVYTFGSGGVNAGPQHSQSLGAWFAQVPGLKVVVPSTPRDVLGLFKSAVRDDNPVLCLFAKRLIGASGEVPEEGEDFTLPIGRAEVRRAGGDITIVGVSAAASNVEFIHAYKLLESAPQCTSKRRHKPVDVGDTHQEGQGRAHRMD